MKFGLWVVRSEEFVAKSGVHVTDNLIGAPQVATLKLGCLGSLQQCSSNALHLGTKLECCQLGRPYSIHMSKALLGP